MQHNTSWRWKAQHSHRGRSLTMCETVEGTSHCLRRRAGSPSSICPHVRQVCPITRNVPDRAERLPHPNGCLHCPPTYFAAYVFIRLAKRKQRNKEGRSEHLCLGLYLMSRQGSLATASAASLRYMHVHQQNTTHFAWCRISITTG
jgi:hypothetical protein